MAQSQPRLIEGHYTLTFEPQRALRVVVRRPPHVQRDVLLCTCQSGERALSFPLRRGWLVLTPDHHLEFRQRELATSYAAWLTTLAAEQRFPLWPVDGASEIEGDA